MWWGRQLLTGLCFLSTRTRHTARWQLTVYAGLGHSANVPELDFIFPTSVVVKENPTAQLLEPGIGLPGGARHAPSLMKFCAPRIN